MARLTDKQRDQILADWSTGQWSQNQLSKRYSVSPATINKLCKDVEQHNADLVNTQTMINIDLVGKSESEVNSIHKAVDERTKHLMFFNNSALKNQNLYNKGLEAIEDEIKNADDKDAAKSIAIANMAYLESHSRSTQRNKETVLGKEPSTTINNTNATQNNVEIQGYGVKVIEN